MNLVHCCEPRVGPSILDVDFGYLSDECAKVLNAGANYLHLDVMDGHFVPAISFGPHIINCIRKHHPKVFFDCHMMTTNPEMWVEQVAKSKGDEPGLLCYTFHVEATEPRGLTQQVIDNCKKHGLKVGLAASPDTPVETLMKYCDQIDLALIMTVYPGKGGQSFMESMMPKVEMLRKNFPKLDIEVDGGVKPATIDAAAKAGANYIVSGSGVYKAKDIAESISLMKRSVEKFGKGLDESKLSPIRHDEK